MAKQRNSEPFLPIDNNYEKGKINICNIASVVSDGKRSIIKDKNKNLHKCPFSISKIYKYYKKYGLLKIKQDKIINLNHILEDEKFDFKRMKLIGGDTHKVANMLQRKLKKLFKKFKLICWKDLLSFILLNLPPNRYTLFLT